MLILTRREAETIRIGDDIEVTVLAIDGGQVRVGLKAPRHVRIDREEVYQRRQRDEEIKRLLSTPGASEPAHAPL